MLVNNLSYEQLPQIRLSDRVDYVLEQMYQCHVQELPVVENEEFVGLIREETLLNADETQIIKDIAHKLIEISINVNDHLLKALSLAVTSHLNILPVTDVDHHFKGVVESSTLLAEVAGFMELEEPGALIVLEIDSIQYSFSEITRLVESNDDQITQLNTTRDKETGKMFITLKVNKLEV